MFYRSLLCNSKHRPAREYVSVGDGCSRYLWKKVDRRNLSKGVSYLPLYSPTDSRGLTESTCSKKKKSFVPVFCAADVHTLRTKNTRNTKAKQKKFRRLLHDHAAAADIRPSQRLPVFSLQLHTPFSQFNRRRRMLGNSKMWLNSVCVSVVSRKPCFLEFCWTVASWRDDLCNLNSTLDRSAGVGPSSVVLVGWIEFNSMVGANPLHKQSPAARRGKC